MTLSLHDLKKAIKSPRAAAFRSKATLQPAGGPGDKVFPPTYAGAVYATEMRRIPGHDEAVPCVLLDSVQSQANRMEEALQQAVDDDRLELPMVEVDFSNYFDETRARLPEAERNDTDLLDPVGKISALQAPHRIADAILRDSVTEDGTPFRQTEAGRKLERVSLKNATPLLELCPTALLFGMWDSTGPKGGLGAKFERALVSEIVGINAIPGVKTSSRIDPLSIQKIPDPLFEAKDGGWTLDESEAKTEKGKPVKWKKEGKPSEANHGNVTPSLSDRDRDTGEYLAGGVTIASAEQTIVLSLPALRRLRFPVNGQFDARADQAGRTVIAALGLCAATLADEAGLDLRSRCLLYPEGELSWGLLDREHNDPIQLTADEAVALLKAAVEEARAVGLPWPEEPLTLHPSKQLLKLVAKSQQLAAKQGGDAEGD